MRSVAVVAGAAGVMIGLLLGWIKGRQTAISFQLESMGQPVHTSLDSVKLTRSAGFGVGANYSVVIARTGELKYRGGDMLGRAIGFAGRRGVHSGQQDSAAFLRLGAAAEALHLLSHSVRPGPGIDSPWATVQLYGPWFMYEHDVDPTLNLAAWLLGEGIDAVVERTRWTPVDTAAGREQAMR